MQIRNLGGSGLRVSAVGLGCNNFGQRIDLEASRKVIHKAIDLGITLFDTADIYSNMGGSETVLGAVLGDRRKDIVLATKYSKAMLNDGTKQGASRRYIIEAVEASLDRERVQRCLGGLTDVQRESITLAYYGGHSYRQVSELLNVTLGAIKTRIRDGLIRMRDCLGVS